MGKTIAKITIAAILGVHLKKERKKERKKVKRK
jgi:hypothetical protein